MLTTKDYNASLTVTTCSSNPVTISGVGTGFSTTVSCTPSSSLYKELYDYCWLYIGDEPTNLLVLHEGRDYGIKSELEKKLLVEFARMFPDIEVSEYTLKMRVW